MGVGFGGEGGKSRPQTSALPLFQRLPAGTVGSSVSLFMTVTMKVTRCSTNYRLSGGGEPCFLECQNPEIGFSSAFPPSARRPVGWAARWARPVGGTGPCDPRPCDRHSAGLCPASQRSPSRVPHPREDTPLWAAGLLVTFTERSTPGAWGPFRDKQTPHDGLGWQRLSTAVGSF